MDATDAALLRSAARGRQDACRVLVSRHGGRVHGVVARIHGDLGETEDIVQEAFLRALRSADAYREDGTFFAWLLRIALRLAQDRRRSRDRRRRREQDQEAPLPGSGPHEQLVRSERQAALRRGLSRIEPSKREVLVLRYFEQLSVEEMASVLGRSVAAVRKELQRARARLRAELQPEFDDG